MPTQTFESIAYPAGLQAILNAQASTTLTVMLLSPSYTPAPSDKHVADISAFELSIGGYSRLAVSSPTAVEDDTNGRAYLTANQAVWSDLATGAQIGWVVLFENTGSDATSPLVAAYRLGKQTITDGGSFTVTFATGSSQPGGLVELDAATQAIPINLSPANGATNVPQTPTLTWNAPGPPAATQFDVYFGTANPPPLVASKQASAVYVPGAGALSVPYYWQVGGYSALGGPFYSAIAMFIAATSSGGTVTTITTTATGTQTNFAPGTLGPLTILRCANATDLQISGLANGTDGLLLWIESVGAGQVDILNLDAGSSAGNQITTSVAATISLAAGIGRAMLAYDATSQTWRVLAHEQGAGIAPAFSAGNFTGAGSMTWTVTSGEVAAYSYYLRGRLLTVTWGVNNTTVGGTLGQELLIAIPGGFLPAYESLVPALYYSDNGGAAAAGFVELIGGSGNIGLFKAGLVNWSAATNGTTLYGSVTFEVQ